MSYLVDRGLSIRTPLKFIGGGTKSNTWVDILANVLGKDAVIPNATDPSLGAALLAGVGIGVFSSLEEAQDTAQGVRRKIKLVPDTVEIYDELFHIYKESQERLRETDHKLSAFALRKKKSNNKRSYHA